ncbi:unnamed protein product [Brassica oleracea var. botrytis]
MCCTSNLSLLYMLSATQMMSTRMCRGSQLASESFLEFIGTPKCLKASPERSSNSLRTWRTH